MSTHPLRKPAAGRAARWTAGGLLWMAMGLSGGILAAAALPVLIGFRSFVVMSGSMEPAIRVGDVVVTSPASPLGLRPGDVVTFKDPTVPGRLITHRVLRLSARTGSVSVVTKGDANHSVEQWSIPANGRLGIVRYRIPKLGYLLVWLRRPAGRLAFIVLPALGLGLLQLARIWTPGRRGGGSPSRGPAPRPAGAAP
jgi:signal peptidase